MYKYNELILVLSILVISGCTSMFDMASNSKFDPNPFQYWQAQVSEDIQLPVYIASNIDREPLYPVPMDKKLSGELKANKAPPTLADNIKDVD